MEAAFALRAEIEKLRVRCVELYEASNQRNAAHLVTIQERDALRAEVETRDARIQSLFQAVEHGDQPHRAWLEAAIGAHFRGDPMPIYVPSETERLKAEIEKLRVLLGKEGDV